MKTTAFGFYPRMFFYKAAVKVYRIAMLANKSWRAVDLRPTLQTTKSSRPVSRLEIRSFQFGIRSVHSSEFWADRFQGVQSPDQAKYWQSLDDHDLTIDHHQNKKVGRKTYNYFRKWNALIGVSFTYKQQQKHHLTNRSCQSYHQSINNLFSTHYYHHRGKCLFYSIEPFHRTISINLTTPNL